MVIRVVLDTDTISSLHLSEHDKMVLMNITEKLHKERTREAAPPPPEGGISLMDAERKYGVHHGTLSRWADKGIIKVVLNTPKTRYIDEESLKAVLVIYFKAPGQGKKTLGNIAQGA